MKNYIRLIRPLQWIKNGLVFVPLFFARSIFDTDKFFLALITFVGFCASASIVYIINDMVDAPSDRLHPRKKHRPLASGAVSFNHGFLIVAILVIILSALVITLIPTLWWIFVLYIGLNILYSFSFKYIPVLDLILVSFFYFLRVEAGGYATNTPISSWLILCTVFVSLFIIVAKRKAEMHHENQRAVLASYTESYLNHLLSICASVTLVSYGIYTVLGQVPAYTVYSNFFLIAIVFRYLHLSYTTNNAERPETAIADPMIISCFILWVLSLFVIFYQ